MKNKWDNFEDISQISLTIAALCVAPEISIFINIGKIGLSIINRVFKINSSIVKIESLPDKIKNEEEKIFILAIKKTRVNVDKNIYKNVSDILKPYIKDISLNKNSIDLENFLKKIFQEEHLNIEREELNEFTKAFEISYQSLLTENSLLSNYYSKLNIDLLFQRVNNIENSIKKEEVIHETVLFDNSFNQLIPFMYRYNYKKRLINAFENKNYSPIVIVGEPGIGKTSLCKELYRIEKNKNKYFNMLFVDLSGVTNLFGMRLAITIALNKNAIDAKSFDELKDNFYKKGNDNFSIYFDNWEDLWNASNDDVKIEISSWINDIANNKIKIVITSRVEIPEITLRKIKLGNLSLDESEKIFKRIYGNNIELISEKNALKQLMDEINGHALSIVLVAFSAKDTFSIEELLSDWYKCKKNLGNPRHTSLDVALRLSWKHISIAKTSNLIWGMLFFWGGNFPNVFFEYLPMDEYNNIEWEFGRNILHNNNLLHYLVEKNDIHMLMAIKNQWPQLNNDSNMDTLCINLLLRTFDNIFRNKDVEMKSMKNEVSRKICQTFPTLISFLDRSWSHENERKIRNLCYKYNDYFQFAPEISIPFLEKILHVDDIIITMSLANCLRRIGKIDEAESLYQKFINNIQLSQIEDYDLAKLYFDYAIMLIRRAGGNKDYTLAKDMLHKAQEIYKRINREIGIANTLRREAELEVTYNNVNEAIKLLKHALDIYQSFQVSLGIANVNYDMGNCYISLKKYDMAEKCFKNTFDLYYSVNCANEYVPSASKIVFCKIKQGKVYNYYMNIIRDDYNKVTDTESIKIINNTLDLLDKLMQKI